VKHGAKQNKVTQSLEFKSRMADQYFSIHSIHYGIMLLRDESFPLPDDGAGPPIIFE
jgi:hypothetical protein